MSYFHGHLILRHQYWSVINLSKDNYFKSLGFNYIFVKNGHDIENVINALQQVRDTKEKVIVHVCTQKGKGYAPAEKDREKWDWAHPFNVETGKFISNGPKENYGAICREFLLNKMQQDKKVTIVNPRFINAIDENYLEGLKKNHSVIVTVEDGIISGGFGSKIAQYYSETSFRVLNCGFSMDIPNRYDPAELISSNGLTPVKITDRILKVMENL